MLRRTRIVVTLGPATDRAGVLESLLPLIDVVRLNFSHGAPDEHVQRVARLRELARSAARRIAVLGDLPGPKLRVLIDQPRLLNKGQEVVLRAGSGRDVIGITDPEILPSLKPDHRVLFDDGRLQLRVARAGPAEAFLRVEVDGTLSPNKGINLPDTLLGLPALTERDHRALQVAATAQVDWLALSFVREASAADILRRAAEAAGLNVPLMAKMERPEAVQQAGGIIEAFDGIMVARGDLGVEIPLEQVPHVQKRLIQLARAAGRPVITATDMLDSMRHNPRPTRAEASDVANAVYDGTDATMLSGETSIGQYPVEAVCCMDQILREAETHQVEDSPREVDVPRLDIEDHISHLTCALARDTAADAIVVPALTGRTVRLVARHRPRMPIVAAAEQETVLRRLQIVWGVHPVPMAGVQGEDRLAASVRAAFAAGAVSVGQRVVVLAGHPVEAGERFPTVRVVRVGEGGASHEP